MVEASVGSVSAGWVPLVLGTFARPSQRQAAIVNRRVADGHPRNPRLSESNIRRHPSRRTARSSAALRGRYELLRHDREIAHINSAVIVHVGPDIVSSTAYQCSHARSYDRNIRAVDLSIGV